MMKNLQTAMRARWNAKSRHYEDVEAHGTTSPAEKERWAKILKKLEASPLDVLDVGTGTGFVALILAELGHRVTGIDWSATMLDRAGEKAREAGLEIAFIEGETEALPFTAASFEAVVARHVLWTLAEPEQALAEWFRVLQPGGRVFADFSPRRPGKPAHHYPLEIEEKLPLNREIGPEKVAALFGEAGFVGIELQKIPCDPYSQGITYLISGFRPEDV